MIGGVDLDVHHRLEKRRARLLHGFLEGQRAGNLEGHIRGIDIMIFAVVKDGAEIHDWKTCEEAARSSVENSFFDGRNPVIRNGAAEDIVDEFEALAELDPLHLYASDAKLALTVRPFLVHDFTVFFPASGF